MNDQEILDAAKKIKKYCKEIQACSECVLLQDIGTGDWCICDMGTPIDWEIKGEE